MLGALTLNHPKVGLHRKEVALRIAPTSLNHPRVGLPRAVAAV
jgi:hypothetical protein